MKNTLASKKITLFIASLLLFQSIIIAQTVQNVRGIVVDKISQSPLPGVAVVITSGTFQIGTSSDLDGNFKFKEVPVGKISLKLSYMGYKEILMQNVVLNAGKIVVVVSFINTGS
jgi:hypothetical protein